MSHTCYYIPQGELGQNNHFDSLVNVLDNSPAGNTLYDNILAWASPSEMSQPRLEPARLQLSPAYSHEKNKNKIGFLALAWQSEDAQWNMYIYKWIITSGDRILFSFWDDNHRRKRKEAWLCQTEPLPYWPLCCLVRPSSSVVRPRGFVSECLCQQSAGDSHWLARSHHSQ